MFETHAAHALRQYSSLYRPRLGATYRLQFHKAFTFNDAADIVPYLAELGVTHMYASPYMMATPGSTHGYDVVDPNRLNPECGSEGAYDEMIDALHRQGMGQILDIVPNHMGISSDSNAWWNSVLELGRHSPYAAFFDIAWDDSPDPRDRGKLVLPILGDSVDTLIARGDLAIVQRGPQFFLKVYDRQLPTAPDSVRSMQDPVDQVLARQHYRLVVWREASERLNYRRFFNINDLAALRMDDRRVFNAVHRSVLERLALGQINGLRIDHPDGLADPAEYFRRLQEAWLRLRAAPQGAAAQGGASQGAGSQGASPLYVVAEKILASDEQLDPDWPVDGTSGYDFLAKVNALFVDPGSADAMTSLYGFFGGAVAGSSADFKTLAVQCKRLMLEDSFTSELRRLATKAQALLQRRLDLNVPSRQSVMQALAQLIVHFPVYRTYLTPQHISPGDRRLLERALNDVPEEDRAVASQIIDAMLREGDFDLPESCPCDRQKVMQGFQQLTAPVTAKGVEDTAMYRFHRLVSLNEVGSDPDEFGLSASSLHAYFDDRQKRWPRALSTLSTHDTKRSEDVRARLNVLADIPDRWREAVLHWSSLHVDLLRHHQQPSIDRGTEYLVYQTLLGAWPPGRAVPDEAFILRIIAYLQKATREAKQHTSWTEVNADYESAVEGFVRLILDRSQNPAFFDSFIPLVRFLTRAGYVNSLSQTLIKLLAPGVPDTYQGTELWDFSLVDPDNRRPVDYAARVTALRELGTARPHDLLLLPDDGRIKLWLTSTVLHFRNRQSEDVATFDYHPAELTGQHADEFFAFGRRGKSLEFIVVVPRFPGRWMGFTANSPIQLPAHMLFDLKLRASPGEAFRDLLSQTSQAIYGNVVPLATVLNAFPMAVLTRQIVG